MDPVCESSPDASRHQAGHRHFRGLRGWFSRRASARKVPDTHSLFYGAARYCTIWSGTGNKLAPQSLYYHCKSHSVRAHSDLKVYWRYLAENSRNIRTIVVATRTSSDTRTDRPEDSQLDTCSRSFDFSDKYACTGFPAQWCVYQTYLNENFKNLERITVIANTSSGESLNEASFHFHFSEIWDDAPKVWTCCFTLKIFTFVHAFVFQAVLVEKETHGPHPEGMAVEEICKLPVETVAANSSTFNQSCNVCLETFNEGERVRTLPCLHVFHGRCLVKWLSIKRRCPNCRSVVLSPCSD